MVKFDISKFALPNSSSSEFRFEEPRLIDSIEIKFKDNVPKDLGVSYLLKYWLKAASHAAIEESNPCWFGWIPTDDMFNSEWKKANIQIESTNKTSAKISFKPLSAEFADAPYPNANFRKTLGVRLETKNLSNLKNVKIYTISRPAKTRIRVYMHCGKKTPLEIISLSSYNGHIKNFIADNITYSNFNSLNLSKLKSGWFDIEILHMAPSEKYSGDDGLITFHFKKDIFTISLTSLKNEGSIWFEDLGIFISERDSGVKFSDYLASVKHTKSISTMVKEREEQTFEGAKNGQPNPHPVSYNLGCKHARQRFWLEPNGDVVLNHINISRIFGRDTSRFKNKGTARFFFGLEKMVSAYRFNAPSPVLAYNIGVKSGNILIEQKSFAVPLFKKPSDPLDGDETIIGLFKFGFTNSGNQALFAEVPLEYSDDSKRSHNPLVVALQNDHLLPRCERSNLFISGDKISSIFEDKKYVRCIYESDMALSKNEKTIYFKKQLAPGESCELLLKIPFIALESDDELSALRALDFSKSYIETSDFWQQEGRRGASIKTPNPHLNAVYQAHLSHVQITDFKMPDNPELINTSVGTSTYGNFTNESCMIVHDLIQRGLFDEAKARLEVWLKYQGTAPQPGNFTDHDGMFFGAGGFEEGCYNQHHGWALWCMCEYYLLSKDDDWFQKNADSIIKGADWIFRQRKNTMNTLPNSRGWEYGFLPAGSLEDVTDFHYWLSTNSLTWRGANHAARALSAINHPEAPRIQKEADDYKHDLISGFINMSDHTPLARLRNGRWIKLFPSRLYCRNRDIGWIRETLEGSIYLLISGLFDSNSKYADWILEDFQDNRYIKVPYGYFIHDFDNMWFDCAGFSIQPNLLAGLIPYLDRDEPEMYIWMFFNAWCSCYREGITALIEHPAPILGYSNSAHFKTSDEANAVMWLRYMFVYTKNDVLYLGRAIPRAWFMDKEEIFSKDVITSLGKASITYNSYIDNGYIEAEVLANLNKLCKKIIVRFRHHEKQRIKSVEINGKKYFDFDPKKDEVYITKFDSNKIKIKAIY